MTIIITHTDKRQNAMTVKAFSHTIEGRLYYTLMNGVIGYIDGIVCVTCKL